MAKSVIRFLNIILAALLAGISLGIWIGFNPKDLSVSTYVEQQQNMLRALRVLMVMLVVLATILTALSAYLQRGNRTVSVALLAAAMFFIACILITRFGNKPIDDTVLSWTSGTIPDNWADLRNKWWSLHISRTVAELAALVLVTWSQIRRD